MDGMFGEGRGGLSNMYMCLFYCMLFLHVCVTMVVKVRRGGGGNLKEAYVCVNCACVSYMHCVIYDCIYRLWECIFIPTFDNKML